MNKVEKIKALLKQAELYKTQGLLQEAKQNYQNAEKIIQSSEQLKKKSSIVDGIAKKMLAVDRAIDSLNRAEVTPEQSDKVQKLIAQLFSFSHDKDEDTVKLEGAIALAKFGQYEKALEEFNVLLKKKTMRVVAAKNILRCLQTSASGDEVIAQYKKWLAGDTFPKNQLKKIKVFTEGLLKKEGVEIELPDTMDAEQRASLELDKAEPVLELEEDEPLLELDEDEPLLELDEDEPLLELDDEPVLEIKEDMDEEEDDTTNEEVLDINSIGIIMDSGSRQGELIEIDVSFQTGNVISLLIPNRDKEIIEFLKVDQNIEDVQFYSPIAIFNGIGIVTENKRIETGPRRGDCSVDIQIVTN